jgi:PAS domain S-box-containing protein
MKQAAKHPRELDRLAALYRLNILDTLPEIDFDEITLIASQVCETPVAMISLIDKDRQWFKSKHGLSVSETPRDISFCAHAILEVGVFVVADATKDERFFDNPLVMGEPSIRFYAGTPLLSAEGLPIGTLCVIDHQPRQLRPDQLRALNALSNQLRRLLELRAQYEQQKIEFRRTEFKRIAIENLQEGVILQDAESRILEFNNSALELLGLSADELTGKISTDIAWGALKEDGSPLGVDEYPALKCLRTGQIQKNITMGIKTGQRPVRWLQVNITPIFLNEPGKPSHAVTSFVDVTEQIKGRKLLERKKAELKRVFDGVPAMIGHWDRNFININANQAYTEYFGRTPEEIKGMSLRELLGEERFQKDIFNLQKTLAGESQSFENTFRLQDGSMRHTLVNCFPEFDGESVIGYFVVVTDITNLKRLEMERQELTVRMVESSKLSTLGEMAGGVAHEINTPLAVIIAKTSLLTEALIVGEPITEDVILQIAKIKLTAERIAKIIKGLRLFSRNSENDPTEAVAVSSVIEMTLDLCREKIKQSQISLKLNLSPEIEIAARPTEISQVLMNLIGNSIDALRELDDKWIEVRSFVRDDRVHIWVTDSGGGISADIVDKLMNPFFTTKEVGKGTGLGLSISRGIIENHGGTICYDRSSDRTRFVIELPMLETLRRGEAA